MKIRIPFVKGPLKISNNNLVHGQCETRNQLCQARWETKMKKVPFHQLLKSERVLERH